MSEAKTALKRVHELDKSAGWRFFPGWRTALASIEVREYLAAIPADSPEQIAALRAELAEITEQTERAMQGECGHPDEVHCSCRPILLRAIEGLKTKIAELKGMTAYARTREAAKQSVEYWREMATLAEEEGKIVKAELGETRERREETIAMCEQLQGELTQVREERENWRNAFCHEREDAERLVLALGSTLLAFRLEGCHEECDECDERHDCIITPGLDALAAYRESRKGDRS